MHVNGHQTVGEVWTQLFIEAAVSLLLLFCIKWLKGLKRNNVKRTIEISREADRSGGQTSRGNVAVVQGN